jgi:hypothetical protein
LNIKVGFVGAYECGLGSSIKLPARLGVKQRCDMLHFPDIRDKTINMSIGGQHIDVIDVSGGCTVFFC